MNINDLTLGQIKGIVEMFQKAEYQSVAKSAIGKYVIVRSHNEGVNCGVVVDADDTGIILKDARRLWYYEPKDTKQSWYEGVANSGLGENSKISPAVERKVIVENYSITYCSPQAEKSLREFSPNGQN